METLRDLGSEFSKFVPEESPFSIFRDKTHFSGVHTCTMIVNVECDSAAVIQIWLF